MEFKVYLNKKHIDSVFYRHDTDTEDIKSSLINHDGYDANIRVIKARAKRQAKVKPFKYRRIEYNSMIIFSCDTDFSKYDYKPEYTLYKKGMFREHENQIVVMRQNIMIPTATNERKDLITNDNLSLLMKSRLQNLNEVKQSLEIDV